MNSIAVDSFDGLSPELLARWERAVAENALNPSLAPGWLRVSSQALAPAGAELQVLTVRDASGAVSGLVPHYLSKTRMLGVPLRALELGSNLMSYHAELLWPDSAELALRSLLQAVPRWDLLRIANVVRGSPTAEAIAKLSVALRAPLQVIPGESSPFLSIRCSWEQFIEGRHKKFRYKWRRRQEQLAKSEACAMRTFTTLASVPELIDAVLCIEKNSWKAMRGIDIASRAAEADYHRLLLPYLARTGALLGIVLFHANRPIAYSLCCCSSGWVGHMKTSFDEQFTELSPGALVIDASVRAAFERQAREFDFLGHAAPHKLAWTSQVRDHADYFLFAPRAKARLIASVKRLKMRLVRSQDGDR